MKLNCSVKPLTDYPNIPLLVFEVFQNSNF